MSTAAEPNQDPRSEYPELRDLTPPPRDRRIPVVPQRTASEGYAACLTSILLYNDIETTLDQAFDVVQRQVDPTSDEAMLKAARQLGLRGRALKLPPDNLRFARRGTIVKWRLGEYVVIDRVDRRTVSFMHPATGRQTVPMREFEHRYRGMGFEFESVPAAGGRLKPTWPAIIDLLLRNRGTLTAVALSSVLLQALALAVPLLTALVVDQVVPRQDASLLTVVAIGMLLLVVFRGLSGLARQYAVIPLQTRVSQELTLDFLDHLVDLPHSFFESQSQGEILQRASANDRIRAFATGEASTLIVDGAMSILYIVLLVVAAGTLGLVAVALATLQVIALVIARRTQAPILDELFHKGSETKTAMLEILAGIEVSKSMGVGKQSLNRWTGHYAGELKLLLRSNRINAVADAVSDTLSAAAPLTILAVGAHMVLEGSLSLGEMLAMNAIALGFIGPFTNAAQTLLELQLLGVYVRRLDEIRVHPPEQDRLGVAPAPRLAGAIKLDQVTFRYDKTESPVVRDVSLSIEPGEFVALVGPSGAGKSTLASLLVGLRTPNAGRVLFDGNDIASFDLRSVRQQLGVVPQQPFLLGATSIRENIALGHSRLGFDRVVQAARMARVHDDIWAMPMKYDTMVPEGGAGFSGGQRQRLALARAVAHRPAILILDEATSALDSLTERAVQESLASLNCTRIVIAHRLSTIRNADRILVMEHGQLTEHGTHEELLAAGGMYADLVESQLS